MIFFLKINCTNRVSLACQFVYRCFWKITG